MGCIYQDQLKTVFKLCFKITRKYSSMKYVSELISLHPISVNTHAYTNDYRSSEMYCCSDIKYARRMILFMLLF